MIKSSLLNKRCTIHLSVYSKKNPCYDLSEHNSLYHSTRNTHAKFSLTYRKNEDSKILCILGNWGFSSKADSREGDSNKNPHLPNPYALRGMPHAVWSDVIKDKHRVWQILKKPEEQHYQGRKCKLNENFKHINVYLVNVNSLSPRWCCKGSQGRFKWIKSELLERSQHERSEKEGTGRSPAFQGRIQSLRQNQWQFKELLSLGDSSRQFLPEGQKWPLFRNEEAGVWAHPA